MRLLIEAARIGAVGILLGIAVGLVRGFPAGAANENATCTAPVPSQPQIRWITPEELHTSLTTNRTAIIDARSRADTLHGHIAGAISIPFATSSAPITDEQVAILRRADTVVVYCDTTGGCAASTRLSQALVARGLVDVRVLEGGFPAWQERGYAAEAGDCSTTPEGCE